MGTINYQNIDINIAYSLINTKLRDNYSSLEELCSAEDLDHGSLLKYLHNAGYYYNKEINQIKQK